MKSARFAGSQGTYH